MKGCAEGISKLVNLKAGERLEDCVSCEVSQSCGICSGFTILRQ